jgi:hypothetical protein
MQLNREFFRKSLVRYLAPAGLTALLAVVPAAINPPGAGADTADYADDGEADYGGGCVLYSEDSDATVDALRNHCSTEQQDQIFRDSPRGDVPMGVKDGWVASPPIMTVVAPALWIGKIFYTGPAGGTVVNRITPADIPAWPADVYQAPAHLDGEPAWALDYAPSPTPQILDEIREVTPGVWLGYSWWRESSQDTLLLTFVLS